MKLKKIAKYLRKKLLIFLFGMFLLSPVVMLTGCSGGGTGTPTTGTTPTGTPATNYYIETVAPFGEYPSIAIDSAGEPHISYLDYKDGYVKYAYKSGTNWAIENVEYVADSNGTIANGGLSSIALDADNNPHICYLDSGTGHFKYARKVGGSWTTRIIPLPNDPYSSADTSYSPWTECSIAVDKTTGTAHVSMQMLGAFGYALGYWNSGLVNAVVVDDLDGNTGYHNSIALDSKGFPHISYEARGDGNLKYASWDGSAFKIETVAPMDLIYWENRLTSLAIDQNDNPHIAYYYNGFKYSYKNGTTWVTEDIPYSSGYPSLSIAIDGTGKPHIAFVGIDTGNYTRLKHAYWDGSSWSFNTIDDDVDQCSIAVDNSGKIHIIYSQGLTDTTIKYAWQ